MRRVKGRSSYLVRWRGYTAEADEWVDQGDFWLSEQPGKYLRELAKAGKAPGPFETDVEVLHDCKQSTTADSAG